MHADALYETAITHKPEIFEHFARELHDAGFDAAPSSSIDTDLSGAATPPTVMPMPGDPTNGAVVYAPTSTDPTAAGAALAPGTANAAPAIAAAPPVVVANDPGIVAEAPDTLVEGGGMVVDGADSVVDAVVGFVLGALEALFS